MPAYSLAAQHARKHIVKKFDFTSRAAGLTAVTGQTVKGLRKDMSVLVWAPALNADLYVLSCKVTAADTVDLVFYNSTGGGIDPGNIDYHFLAL